jgi:MGT family glycosyltransferase
MNMPFERKKRHFGVLSFTGTGHLNSLISLSQSLKDRGHKITFFEKPKIEDQVRQAGLDFIPIGKGSSSSKGRMSRNNTGPCSKLSDILFNLERIERDLKMYLNETPRALVEAGIDALLVNEIAVTGPTVAQIAGLPYIIISTSVPHHFGWKAYPEYLGYKYSASWHSKVETVLFEVSALRMRGPIRRVLNEHRRKVGLGPVQQARQSFPELAHITQLPQCLDLPRCGLPGNFHYTGPFANSASRPQAEFPWDRLDGRPLLYMSLGTTRNVQAFVFRLVAEACKDLDLQLVISLGGRFDTDMFPYLPGNPLVIRYAPQLELLRLATLVITHGGPNTVFEALMEGKPMVAIPLAHDQPAIAARLERLGIAEVLPVMRLTASSIHRAVTKVLHDSTYRNAAITMQAELHSLRGPQRAADVIEKTIEEYLANPRHASAADLGRTMDGLASVSFAPR